MAIGYHRPTKAVISLKAIQHNYQTIKQHQPQNQPVWAVIKADGYGHGAVRIAQALSKQHVDGFCVAISDEAFALRENKITAPILILGISEVNDAWLLAKQNISATVASLDWLKQALALKPNTYQGAPLNIHIKIDSGMGRIGVRTTNEAQMIVDFIAEHLDCFNLEGIFTHYATADGDDTLSLSKQHAQSNFFKTIYSKLNFSKLPKKPRIHQSNSAMGIWFPEETLNGGVRLGIGLYGSNPSNGAVPLPSSLHLKPALSLETEIIYVKQMQAGDTISYGATYTASEGEWIATLPIGYADGWNRALTGFEVLVEGNRCPIVGRICMDQCMIRLPKPFPTGTKVTLIGENHEDSITAEEVAHYLHTISYEVMCAISTRVPREYH